MCFNFCVYLYVISFCFYCSTCSLLYRWLMMLLSWVFFVLGDDFYSCSWYHRIFVVYSSYVHLLEVVAYRCGLPFHSCVSEVADDVDVIGGVELEVPIAWRPIVLSVAFSRHVLLLVCRPLMTRLLYRPFVSFNSCMDL